MKTKNNLINKNNNTSCFFSGSLPQKNRDEQSLLEDKAKELCSKISRVLIKNGIKIYTCFGMILGNYISFPVTEFCFENDKPISSLLEICPISQAMINKEIIREKVILQGDFFIVMGGGNSKDSGVYKEYQIALKQNKIIIPIPTLGGCGKLIYDEIINDTDFDSNYGYLTDVKTALNSENIDEVVDAVNVLIKQAI